jgi:hypothetical protein
VFDKDALLGEKLAAERQLRNLDIAHKAKITPKKGIEDMMKQERVDNINR